MSQNSKGSAGSNVRRKTILLKEVSIVPGSSGRTGSKGSVGVPGFCKRKDTIAAQNMIELERAKIRHRKLSAVPVTYKQIQDKFTSRANMIHEDSRGLDKKLVENILAYTQLLPKYRSDQIDQDIFNAVMYRRFDVLNNWSCTQFYRVLLGEERRIRKNKKYGNDNSADGTISVDALTRFLCMLLSDKVEEKAKLVFLVYDYTNTGKITKSDISYMLSPVIGRLYQTEGGDELDTDYNADFLVNEIARKLDIGEDGIRREQFFNHTREDEALLSILGPCLPKVESLASFRALLTGKSKFDIQSKFREERRDCLCTLSMQTGYVQSLYPVELENI